MLTLGGAYLVLGQRGLAAFGLRIGNAAIPGVLMGPATVDDNTEVT